jgi:glucose-1-phosphate thymidylyltransferase
VVKKPEDPPSNLVMTVLHVHSGHLPRLPSGAASNCDEYETSDAIDLLLHSGRTIDAIRLDGWRNDIGYPEARDQAEKRLQGEIDPGMAAEAIQVNGE